MASKVQKLRDLTSAPATPEHQAEFDRQMSDKADDRSFTLLLTAMLENELDKAIEHWFGGLAPKLRKSMYELDGPMGNLSRKITLAAAFELLGPVTHENFRLIRHVRNAFAHAKVPITFATEQVANVCADLQRINIFDPPEEDLDQEVDTQGRERFEMVCNEMMIRLSRYTGHDVEFVGADGVQRHILQADLP